jgi:hypothetical protein
VGYGREEFEVCDGFLIRTDTIGDTVWSTKWTGDRCYHLHSVEVTSDGGYIATGYHESKVWLGRTDGEGDTLWTCSIGGFGSGIGQSVREVAAGEYIVAGYAAGPGSYDFLLIRTGKEVAVDEAPPVLGQTPTSQVLPSPVSHIAAVSYELPYTLHIHMAVFNASGQRVRTLLDETKPAGHHTLIWNTTNDSGRRVPSGTYFLRLEANGERATRKLVVVR